MIQVEVCAFDIASALAAQEAGAIRVELCANPQEGGTTPSYGLIRQVRHLLKIQVFVIIRPRGGDFCYDAHELESMRDDIRLCGELACDGVVIGLLNPRGEVDTEHTGELVSLAHSYGMEVTFHRAFDRAACLFTALEEVISSGCARILTSGGKSSAPEGASIIRQLIEKAGGRIEVMPGGGITPENIGGLVRESGLKVFHGSFRSSFPGKMQYRHPGLGWKDEVFEHLRTDAAKVREALRKVRE